MIRHILKTLLLLLWCMLSAYLINVSVKLFVPSERMAAPVFSGMYIGTVVLMLVYACIINGVYHFIVDSKVSRSAARDRKLLTKYLAFAVIPLVLVHRLLLQVVVMVATKGEIGMADIFSDIAYWKKDFPFLLVPLVLTALFFYYCPQCRIFKGDKGSVVPGRQDVSAFDWREYRLPNILLEQLRKVLDPTISVVDGRIRVFDIVFILYENQSYFAVLSNGEKYLLPRFRPSMLAEWVLGCWFVQINNTVRVNMLYLQHSLEDRKNLTLDETVDLVLFGPQGQYSRELLRIGRSGAEHIKDFLHAVPTVADEGWNEWTVEVR